MSSATEADFRPYDAAFVADPYPVYARLREHSPICHSAELDLTLFTRYDDIRRLLLDKRLGRSMDHVRTPEQIERQRRAEQWQRLPNYSRYVRVNLLETEGEDHTRVRRLVTNALHPARIRTLRERIAEVVDTLLTRLAPRKEMDFIADLAVPLPVYMITELLGWPAEERHRLRPWSADIVRLYERNYTQDDEQRAEVAATDFAAMLDALAGARRAEPRDDLISALAAQEGQPAGLSRQELIATCMLLLNAGHEATVNAAGNGLLALLRHPEQLARLREQPALITTAIEEFLRYDSPLQLFHRYVLKDMEYAGVRLEYDDKVGFLYGSANRDPAAFERADEFDIARRPNRHLAFGAGTHFCVGAPLARLELELLFGALLRRLPGLRLEEARPEFHAGLVFRGLQRLRVGW